MFILGVLHAYFIFPPIQADFLYAVMVASDLARHAPIVAWWLPPANGFFPDVTVAILGYAAGLHGFNDTAFLQGFYCAWLFVTAYAWMRAGKIAPYPAMAAAAIGIATFDLLDPNKTLLSWTMMTPTAHNGIVGFELLGAAAYLRLTATGDRRVAFALVSIMAIGVFSDRIILAHFAAPVGFLAAISWARRRKASEAIALASIAAGAVVGWAALKLMNAGGTFNTAQIPYMMHYRFGRAQLSYVVHHLDAVTGVMHAIFYAVAYLALLYLFAARSRTGNGLLLANATLMSTAALLTPIVAQIWVDDTAIRYQLPFFLIPATIVSAVLLRSPRLCAAVIGIVVVCAVAINGRGIANASNAEQRYDVGIASLAEQLSARGTNAVMAQYWMAKPLLFVTDYRLNVCQITNEGDIYPWITDVAWCVAADRAMRSASTTAVVDFGDALDEAALNQRYGAKVRVEGIAGTRVFYYRAAPVEKFLRRQLCTLVPSLHGTGAGSGFGCSGDVR